MADAVALENLLRDAGVHASIFDDTLRSLDKAGICCVDDLLLFPTETDLESCGVKKAAARRIGLQLARIAPKSPSAPFSIPLVVPDLALLSAEATPQARRVASKVLSSPPAPRQRALASAFDLAADDAPALSALGSAEAAVRAATRLQATARRLAAEETLWEAKWAAKVMQERWRARRAHFADLRYFGAPLWLRMMRFYVADRRAREHWGLLRRWTRVWLQWRRSLVCYEVAESFWMVGADGDKTEKADVEANLPCLQGQESEPSATHSHIGVNEPDYSATGNHGTTSCRTTPRLVECGIVGISHVPLGSSGLTARSILATPQPTSGLAQLIAAVRARRRPPPEEKDARGLFILDSHLPRPWRLETHVWAQARALPGEGAQLAMREDACRWNDFFSRVLPLPGSGSCIHNEDFPELLFDVSAAADVRAASLRALGWPEGCLPGKPALLEHLLLRVEHEYAEHCFHDHVPGKRCSTCSFDFKKFADLTMPMRLMNDSDSDDACGDDGGAVDQDSDGIGGDAHDTDDETDISAGFCSAEPTA